MADIAGKALGAVAAVEHGIKAVEAFESGDIGTGLLNTGKVAADLILINIKASSVGIALTVGYAIFDIVSFDW